MILFALILSLQESNIKHRTSFRWKFSDYNKAWINGLYVCSFLCSAVLVPLKSIEVELQVRDHVATVVSTLTYENKEDKPVEAVFVFPLPGDAAVCHFSAKIGQTHIVAEVKEKQQVSWTDRFSVCCRGG